MYSNGLVNRLYFESENISVIKAVFPEHVVRMNLESTQEVFRISNSSEEKVSDCSDRDRPRSHIYTVHTAWVVFIKHIKKKGFAARFSLEFVPAERGTL